jgi:hypothetical protein
VIVSAGDIYNNKWTAQFDKNFGGPSSAIVFDELKSWTEQNDPFVKYYSGTAIYSNTFTFEGKEKLRFANIKFDSICDIATIKINGIDCGTLWTAPYKLNITKALKNGENKIEIEVSNTWHNRLIGDSFLSPEKRITWTTAPFRLNNKPLLPAGIIGDIKIITSFK